jgi:hypothetical protein
MGSFGTALAGVNTPETQQADDDYAVGRLVEVVAHSPYAASTLIIITEDDAQDGLDHVDSHRSTAYVVGPYVKQGAVVSDRYSQVNVLRTIEDLLGTRHINLNTAFQRPMSKVFDIGSSSAWNYTATASTVLKTTTLVLAEGDSRKEAVKFGGRAGYQAEAQRSLLGKGYGRLRLLGRGSGWPHRRIRFRSHHAGPKHPVEPGRRNAGNQKAGRTGLSA